MDTTIAVIWHLNDPFEIKSKRNLQVHIIKADLCWQSLCWAIFRH